MDAKKVGIEGVSRFGKAALVAMAFEPRFAAALVGSSGEGGPKPMIPIEAEPGRSVIGRLATKSHKTILSRPVCTAITLPFWEIANAPMEYTSLGGPTSPCRPWA